MESDESIHAHCDFQARWVFLSEFFNFRLVSFLQTFKHLALYKDSALSKRLIFRFSELSTL